MERAKIEEGGDRVVFEVPWQLVPAGSPHAHSSLGCYWFHCSEQSNKGEMRSSSVLL